MSSKPHSQLIRQVSPYEEQPITDQRCPFDSTAPEDDKERHGAADPSRETRRGRSDAPDETRVKTPRFFAGDIPEYVLVPRVRDDDGTAEITLDDAFFGDSKGDRRTLTPHPSLDGALNDSNPTTNKSQYLSHSWLDVELDIYDHGQDWPSDEDDELSETSKMKDRKRNDGHPFVFATWESITVTLKW